MEGSHVCLVPDQLVNFLVDDFDATTSKFIWLFRDVHAKQHMDYLPDRLKSPEFRQNPAPKVTEI